VNLDNQIRLKEKNRKEEAGKNRKEEAGKNRKEKATLGSVCMG
jgi:hypothetical protein